MTTSWDCFDTLVTRRKLDPLTVFHDMGARLGMPDFTHRRKAAESRAPWTLASIYEELAKDYGWSDAEKERIKALEIEAELEHCCPIVENLRQVKDGDLIVSDMYLPAEVIEQILRKNGLTADVQIFVSTGGKSSGTIWGTLPHIDQHIGDNLHSDFHSPQTHGIIGVHYTNVFPSPVERAVGGELCLLMRLIRLANPYQPGSVLHSMWHEQAQLNIPALILAALEIPATNVTFMMRDCIHLQPIHQALHGTINNSFHASRLAFEGDTPAFRKHAECAARGRLIVDLQGTGGSIINYWRKVFNETPELLYVTGTLSGGHLLAYCHHDAIERFNSSCLGSMRKDWPGRFVCEYDPTVIKCQLAAVQYAIKQLPFFSIAPDLDRLRWLVSLMPDSVTFAENNHQSSHGD